jgi:hypothetical protein
MKWSVHIEIYEVILCNYGKCMLVVNIYFQFFITNYLTDITLNAFFCQIYPDVTSFKQKLFISPNSFGIILGWLNFVQILASCMIMNVIKVELITFVVIFIVNKFQNTYVFLISNYSLFGTNI